ncbi:hypothetical protein B0T10DRAFT_56374 [Thelonectria olida]|uniref:Uncharacterized protein n=1 Tax=Thelonectria olida TaxID=1576542 RepID=A0A9P9APG1_9HYPO|nr:hypothetical protein B0T10DRAFT_56374 [Thelonectria olida]
MRPYSHVRVTYSRLLFACVRGDFHASPRSRLLIASAAKTYQLTRITYPLSHRLAARLEMPRRSRILLQWQNWLPGPRRHCTPMPSERRHFTVVSCYCISGFLLWFIQFSFFDAYVFVSVFSFHCLNWQCTRLLPNQPTLNSVNVNVNRGVG